MLAGLDAILEGLPIHCRIPEICKCRSFYAWSTSIAELHKVLLIVYSGLPPLQKCPSRATPCTVDLLVLYVVVEKGYLKEPDPENMA